MIAAGVTACSSAKSDSAPTKLSPAAASPVASPSPSLTPEAQAEAAVQYYFSALNESLDTGDISRLQTLSTPACSCRRLVTRIQDGYANGRLLGASFIVEQLVVKGVQGITADVEVRYHTSAYAELDTQGHVVRAYQAGPGHDLMSLAKAGETWQVDQAVRLG